MKNILMKKIRVLHVINTLDLGGAESNLYNLSKGFNSDRYEMHIAYSSGGEYETKFRKSGVPLFKFAERSHRIKSPASLMIIARLMAYILKYKIDIVHTHSFNTHIWGGIAGRLCRTKVIEHVHDARYMDPEEYFQRQGKVTQFYYAPYLKNLSNVTVVLTQQNIDYLVRTLGRRNTQVCLISNGIPRIEPNLEEADLKLPDGSKVILTPSRLSSEKNVRLILDIAPSVIQQTKDAHFVIAGDGPQMEELKQEVAAKKLDQHIHFVGFVPNIKGYLQKAQVFLLPSLLELHSIAILEAMRSRVPLVISEGIGCHDEIFTDRKNALLRDPFSKNGWAEAIIELLESESLTEKISKSAHNLFEKAFVIDHTVRRFEQLYDKLASA